MMKSNITFHSITFELVSRMILIHLNCMAATDIFSVALPFLCSISFKVLTFRKTKLFIGTNVKASLAPTMYCFLFAIDWTRLSHFRNRKMFIVTLDSH